MSFTDKWELVALGELAIIQSGGTPSRSKPSYWGGDIPWVKISDIKQLYVDEATEFITEDGLKNSSARIFPKGTILLTIFATIGRIGILNFDATTNQAIAGITPNEKIESKFLVYALIQLSKTFLEKAKGVAQKNINLSILKESLIPLPPLAEQKRIVAKLDETFKHIEILKSKLDGIPVLLKQFKQTVLTHAVTGKLININGFDIVSLGGELADVKYGTSQKSFYDSDGTPVLRIPNVKYGEIEIGNLKYSNLEAREYDKLKLSEGDILIIRSNGSISIVGQTAIIRKESAGYAYAGYLVRLRTNSQLNAEYLNYVFKSNFLRKQIEEMARSTSGINNINTDEIKNLQIPLPNIDEQKGIVQKLESLFSIADKIECQYKVLNAKTDKLPQALLAKAFKGELVAQNPTDGDANSLLYAVDQLPELLQVAEEQAVYKKVKK